MAEDSYAQPAAAPGQAEKESGLSFKGLWEVFFSPTDFFARLKTQPKILVPYIAILIAVVIFFMVAGEYIVRLQLETEQAQEQIQRSGMSEEQMAEIMSYSTKIMGTVFMMLIPLIIAGLAMFWGNFVMAGNARFKQVLSVALYAEFLFAVGTLLHLPLIVARESIMVSYSLGVLVADQGPESVLYVALSKISVFHIWELIVLGFGLSIIYDFPRNKGIWLAVLSMGLLSILHVVTTAITVAFS